MRALMLLPLILLSSCMYGVPTPGTNNTCDEPVFSVTAERINDGAAQLNAEFIPTWGEPGNYGWHMSHVWNTPDELTTHVDWDMLEDIIDNTDFAVNDIDCVRFNITYGDGCEQNPDGDCRWLCEGNGASAHLTSDVDFGWFYGEQCPGLHAVGHTSCCTSSIRVALRSDFSHCAAATVELEGEGWCIALFTTRSQYIST